MSTPVDSMVLALKRCGGAADVRQLAATTGLPESRIRGHLHALEGTGEVFEVDGTWRLAVRV